MVLPFHFALSPANIVGGAVLRDKNNFRFIFIYTSTMPFPQLLPILKFLLKKKKKKKMEMSGQVTVLIKTGQSRR